MSFVVGDIQGCYKGLRKLLEKANFDAQEHRLYAVGDLVARGPNSLDTMLFLMDLGERFDCVLGNHDLHLIAIAHGVKNDRPQDNLRKLIKHKKFPQIIDWLLQKPLALKPAPKTLISHAGLYPMWSIKQALAQSALVEEELQGSNPSEFLRSMYGNKPDIWEPSLPPKANKRFTVNAFTRMRYLDANMGLEFATKCHPSLAPNHLNPWFLHKNKHLQSKQRLIFGHWASLNGLQSKHPLHKTKLFGLDTGYVWGNKFSLLDLSSEKIIQHRA